MLALSLERRPLGRSGTYLPGQKQATIEGQRVEMSQQQPEARAERGPFPWRSLVAGLSEIAGLLLIAYVLYLVWEPLPLALLGLLLVYLPNRA